MIKAMLVYVAPQEQVKDEQQLEGSIPKRINLETEISAKHITQQSASTHLPVSVD